MGGWGPLQTLLDYFSYHPQMWHVIRMCWRQVCFLKGVGRGRSEKEFRLWGLYGDGFQKITFLLLQALQTCNAAAASLRSEIWSAMMGEMTISLRKGKKRKALMVVLLYKWWVSPKAWVPYKSFASSTGSDCAENWSGITSGSQQKKKTTPWLYWGSPKRHSCLQDICSWTEALPRKGLGSVAVNI